MDAVVRRNNRADAITCADSAGGTGKALRRLTHPLEWASSEISAKSGGISSTNSYGFSSILLRIGGGLGQFWPILMPVMRAHFLAGHGTAGKFFYRFAVLGGNSFLSVDHLGHKRRRHFYGFR